MIGHRLRIVLLVFIALFVGLEIAPSVVWMKHEIARSFAHVAGIRSPIWFGPAGKILQAIVQSAVLVALLSIDMRLQRKQ